MKLFPRKKKLGAFNVENRLDLKRENNVDIWFGFQRWTMVVQRCNLNSTIPQRWNNVACLVGSICIDLPASLKILTLFILKLNFTRICSNIVILFLSPSLFFWCCVSRRWLNIYNNNLFSTNLWNKKSELGYLHSYWRNWFYDLT